MDKGMMITGIDDESPSNFIWSLCLSNLHLIFDRFGTKCDTGNATGCCNESWEIFRMVWANI